MGVAISNISIYLPEERVTNEALASNSERWTPQKIETKLGIRERRVAHKFQTAGDLAFNAAELVLEHYDRSNIDMLILCT
jgi:3-oxoacyl-[acyl-carrier-protein] synthase-3